MPPHEGREGGASGSGSARKPSAAAGGGERRKRPNDEDKENPRKKVSRIVRDLEETVSQYEHRGEEITRLVSRSPFSGLDFDSWRKDELTVCGSFWVAG